MSTTVLKIPVVFTVQPVLPPLEQGCIYFHKGDHVREEGGLPTTNYARSSVAE